jgi:aminoglycoside 6'-N-acetyltransferase I
MSDGADVITVRPSRSTDRAELVRMRTALWPDSVAREVDELVSRPRSEYVVLVAEREAVGLRGFAEVGHRPYAEGCATSPDAYLEGIWVDVEWRRSGVATSLLRAAEDWARSLGLAELASDSGVDNESSQAFHRAAGFEEVERIVCYRRDLTE